MALDKELTALFGRQVVAQAKRMPLEEVVAEAELVAEGVRQLLEQQGRPMAQRQIVAGMDEATALALCRWIQEPRILSKVAVIR